MRRTCSIGGAPFDITEKDLSFYERISPSFGGTTYPIPAPTLSPVERQRRRLSFRNIRTLYRRKCDLSARSIVSCYPAESRHTVYHTDEWWSDRWDALSYGRDFDFNRPFFDQFAELYRAVPLVHLYQTPNENCEYVNGASNCRNCYLSFLMDYCEDCYYLTVGNNVKSSLDSFGLTRCELCYECVDCTGCYSLRSSVRCSGCSDSAFLFQCRECRSCIGCCNLSGKEYHLFNRQVSKDEIEQVAAGLSSAAAVRAFEAEFARFAAGFPRRASFGHSNEEATGDNLSHSRGCESCFDGHHLEDCAYCNFFFASDHSMDVNYFGDASSWLYECLATGLGCANNSFCMLCWSGSHDNLYCHLVSGSSHCFGCSGLKHKQYCVLNREYSPADYERLVAQIIEHMQRTGEWGEFFPSTLSPFPFNFSQAQDYLPLAEAEARARGLEWGKRDAAPHRATEQMAADTIEEPAAARVNTPLRCAECGADFKIIEPEMKFYRVNRIPPPAACPECRHRKRARFRNAPVLRAAKCSVCSLDIATAYPSDAPFPIYCERCFAQAVS